jgi:2-polyprenyl-6-methoxyphenol hydroxylase-like FAD-dependent oxidoreductase
MPDHDVAIVGAGPVGLLLACLLAQSGIDIAVYEKRAGEDERSRAIGIHPPGIAALDEAGLGASVRSEALGLDGGEVLCGGRVLASVSFTPRQRVLILPQHRTHALLRSRLAELAPDALHFDHGVQDLHEDGAVVHLSLDAAGAHRDATASVVVAADGVRSGIRDRLGIPWHERPGSGSYVMADVPEDDVSPWARLHCEAGGLVEAFPLPDGRRRWVVGDPEGRLQDPDSFAQAILERTGVRPTMPEDSPTPFRAQQHRAARASRGRVVLLGDALHETSPIGGQGMNLGWTAATQLAVAVEQTLRAGPPDFAAYERSVLRSAARAQRRSAFYMAMGRPARGAALGARNTVISVLGSAPLRGRTADLITMRGL